VRSRKQEKLPGFEEVASWVMGSSVYRRLAEIGIWNRLGCVQRMGPRGRTAEFSSDDPYQVLDELLATGRFCRDTRLGACLHRGAICLRERSPGESLHVALYPDTRRLRAHLDRISPIGGHGMKVRRCGYSSLRVIAHIVSRLAEKLAHRLLGGWKEINLQCADFCA